VAGESEFPRLIPKGHRRRGTFALRQGTRIKQHTHQAAAPPVKPDDPDLMSRSAHLIGGSARNASVSLRAVSEAAAIGTAGFPLGLDAERREQPAVNPRPWFGMAPAQPAYLRPRSWTPVTVPALLSGCR
jgi:hypothetical protein